MAFIKREDGSIFVGMVEKPKPKPEVKPEQEQPKEEKAEKKQPKGKK